MEICSFFFGALECHMEASVYFYVILFAKMCIYSMPSFSRQAMSAKWTTSQCTKQCSMSQSESFARGLKNTGVSRIASIKFICSYVDRYTYIYIWVYYYTRGSLRFKRCTLNGVKKLTVYIYMYYFLLILFSICIYTNIFAMCRETLHKKSTSSDELWCICYIIIYIYYILLRNFRHIARIIASTARHFHRWHWWHWCHMLVLVVVRNAHLVTLSLDAASKIELHI